MSTEVTVHGGGHNHKPGCRCPYCASTSTREEAGDVLLAPPTDPVSVFADRPEAFTKRYEKMEDKLAAYKDELDQAVANLDTDENWLNYLDVMSRFHRYSANNQLLIAIQTHGRARKVAGFKAWQEKFGRSVNKGEKAITILAPRKVRVTETDGEGKPVKGPDGKPVKRSVLIGFTGASVFDVSQTNGPDLPELEEQLSEEPPDGFVADMEAAAKAAGYDVEYREMNSHAAGTAQGWSDPHNKQIVIDSSLTPGSQAATLAHELGHVYAGHCDDLSEYHTGPGGCRGRYEVEAESIAYSLGRANGMAMSSAKLSAQYVAGWSRHDAKALGESAERVSKATQAVLAAADFRNVDDD